MITVNKHLESALLDAMKSGFMDASGVDPARMKTIIAAMVFAVIFMIGAWIGKQILEAYGAGDMNQSELTRLIISILVIFLIVLVFLGWF